MTLNSAEFSYAGDGEVYVAPVGTAMPVAYNDALNAAFLGLGYTTEDGVAITPSLETSEVRSWQSFEPTDRRITSRNLSISATLQQLNKTTWDLNMGGGSWATSTGTHTFTPPDPEDIDYRALIVHWEDGSDITRLLIPKVLVTEPGSFQLSRSNPSEIALTFGIISTGVGNPYTVTSNRAEFA